MLGDDRSQTAQRRSGLVRQNDVHASQVAEVHEASDVVGEIIGVLGRGREVDRVRGDAVVRHVHRDAVAGDGSRGRYTDSADAAGAATAKAAATDRGARRRGSRDMRMVLSRKGGERSVVRRSEARL